MSNIGILRPIADNEIELVRTWRNTPSIRANMYTRHEIGVEEHCNWWRNVQSREDQQYFMYEYTDKPHGVVAFNCIDIINKNASWAIYKRPELSKGIGKKMGFLALEYAFFKLGIHKLYCEALSFNTVAIEFYQKIGFKIEGIFREHHQVDEKFVDIYRFGILASEWAIQRNQILKKITSSPV